MENKNTKEFNNDDVYFLGRSEVWQTIIIFATGTNERKRLKMTKVVLRLLSKMGKIYPIIYSSCNHGLFNECDFEFFIEVKKRNDIVCIDVFNEAVENETDLKFKEYLKKYKYFILIALTINKARHPCIHFS